MRKAATDLSSRNIKGGVGSRKRGNPSFTKVPPLNGGDARSKYKSKRSKKKTEEERETVSEVSDREERLEKSADFKR